VSAFFIVSWVIFNLSPIFFDLLFFVQPCSSDGAALVAVTIYPMASHAAKFHVAAAITAWI
jgi:hypothetical protein